MLLCGDHVTDRIIDECFYSVDRIGRGDPVLWVPISSFSSSYAYSVSHKNL
jgi:hypothetical protein